MISGDITEKNLKVHNLINLEYGKENLAFTLQLIKLCFNRSVHRHYFITPTTKNMKKPQFFGFLPFRFSS